MHVVETLCRSYVQDVVQFSGQLGVKTCQHMDKFWVSQLIFLVKVEYIGNCKVKLEVQSTTTFQFVQTFWRVA